MATERDDWRESIGPILARFEGEMPAGFEPDFSAASLGRLERIMLDRFPPGTAPDGPFAEAAMAYVGESLLHAGGGSWGWDAEARVPLVRPADAPPIPPLALLVQVLTDRTGDVLTQAQAALIRPGPPPAREPTPGVDDIEVVDTSPWLADWLAAREKSFPAWSAGAGGDWDFSPASLETLNQLVKRRLPGPGALTDPAHAEFVEGAVWYAGEVARRHKQATSWRYSPAVPGSTDLRESYEMNPYVGRPYIRQTGPDADSFVPVLALELALTDDDEDDWLRTGFDRMA